MENGDATTHLTNGFTKICLPLMSVFSTLYIELSPDKHIHYYLSYHQVLHLSLEGFCLSNTF